MGIQEYTLQDIQDSFSFLEDWEDKYRYLLELGDKLPPMQERDKTETNKVTGCVSQVWMKIEEKTGDNNSHHLYFIADSDAHIVRGLIAILMIIYNGKSPQEILEISIREIFSSLGLDSNLSPTRRNGFFSMVQKLQTVAAGAEW